MAKAWLPKFRNPSSVPTPQPMKMATLPHMRNEALLQPRQSGGGAVQRGVMRKVRAKFPKLGTRGPIGIPLEPPTTLGKLYGRKAPSVKASGTKPLGGIPRASR